VQGLLKLDWKSSIRKRQLRCPKINALSYKNAMCLSPSSRRCGMCWKVVLARTASLLVCKDMYCLIILCLLTAVRVVNSLAHRRRNTLKAEVAIV